MSATVRRRTFVLISTLLAWSAPSSASYAQRGGYIPPVVYESAQPRPQWSQAERDRGTNPADWLQRLFGGGKQQTQTRVRSQPGSGAASASR